MLTPKIIIAAFLLIAVVFVVSYLALKTPSNHLDWREQFVLLPKVSINGDDIAIRNIRDFRYESGDKVALQRYLNGEYKFSQLKRLWYGISHFGPMGMAHVFVSFEFEDGQYLVVSIEARLQNADDTYHPIHGLFRQYQKTLVLATEQDVIGLRTHVRKERVYLYPLVVEVGEVRELLKNFLLMAQSLEQKPEFYNTFSDNCMTGLLKVTRSYNNWWQWLDYRIILPGFSDRLSLDAGLIPAEASLAATQLRYYVDGDRGLVTDEDFSEVIRQPKVP